jgi:hypothetical protein
LEVTWDSSRPNSYFLRPLSRALNKRDDFGLEFEVQIESVAAGINPGKPFAFELAVALLNWADATNANFIRGTGLASPNLVEFDYFPDTGFGATISPVIVSSNNQFVPSFSFPLELTPGDRFHVTMKYSATNQTLVTTMTRNGLPFGPIQDVRLNASFTDFKVDTVAICSYSDAGAEGSILARGVIDNLGVIVPEPPLIELAAWFQDQTWHVEFSALSGWFYCLERTADFQDWIEVIAAVAINNDRMILSDLNAPASRAFYRVRAEQP